MSEDALFDPPRPAHPDQQVAYEEIGRYYDDRVTEARAAFAEAQRLLNRCLAEQDAWVSGRKITPEMIGSVDMAPSTISAASMDRYHAACKPVLAQMSARGGIVVNNDPNIDEIREEAVRLGKREKDLRRWLTAQGYYLGLLAEPPAEQRPRRPRRR